MIVRPLEEAQCDLEEAVRYHNAERPGLEYEFAEEAYRTFDGISAHPKAWPRVSEQIRRCITNRFPYAVLCRLEESEIVVVALMHMRRHPDTWRRRIA